MKTASDEDATRDGEEKEEEEEEEAPDTETEPLVKKSNRGRKPAVSSARRVTRFIKI